MPTERFNLSKGHSTKKPWIVVDTKSDPCEDPVIYHFTSKRKAEEFTTMMHAEHGNQGQGT